MALDNAMTKTECEELANRVAVLESDNAVLLAEKTQWLNNLETDHLFFSKHVSLDCMRSLECFKRLLICFETHIQHHMWVRFCRDSRIDIWGVRGGVGAPG